MKLTLHNYWRSSASYRTRIGLGLKQLAYDYVPVNLVSGEQHTDAYRTKNPIAQVPTLEITEDDGRQIKLTQSLAILEYLDERWPDPPILPRDPYLRARTRMLAEIANAGMQPMHNLVVLRRISELGGDSQAWPRPFLVEGLTAFARLSEDVSGQFCIGNTPTIADCCLVPQLLAARRFHVDLAGFERLVAIEAHCLTLPAFAAAMPHHQPDAVNP
jgi:maleylpyruvate isomerase